jgi:ATP-dependent Lon protease
VVRSYIEWIVSLPWKKTSPLKKGAVKKSLEVLNEHHYGLEKVKEKVTDFLAVQERSGRKGGAVLCLVGAPGVGKTSLGKSIAKATGRKFVRVSLGGMRDESEIRGHRRTYVGSMPGKILQALKNVQVSNPLILLDEVDKVGADWRGDPASALLEVLDKEQNSTFEDHYLGFPYDLSQVMFVCTANTLNIPSPLLDRMEVIRIPGYTEEERVDIATRYLLPKNKKEAGLKGGELWVESEAVRHLIRHYCREAGVRQLDRELANICRKVTKEILLSEEKVPVVKKVSVKGRVQEAPAESKPSVVTMTEDKEGALEKSTSEARFIVTSENLKVYSGIERYFVEVSEKEPAVGITAGLAWTEVGGSILFIEALFLPGKGGQIISTGKLGDVMKESIQAALSYAKFRAFSYGVHPKSFEKRDLHIHVPEGATPKDGPSAGVAMITSIVSVLTGIPVRSDVAMTGEISLRGRVMAIGGVKEKLLSAARGGIKTVLIPRDNMKDLEDIPDSVKSILEIIPVSHADEVLKHSLVRPLVPIQEEDLDHRDKLLKMDLVNSMKPQENSRESSVRSLS